MAQFPQRVWKRGLKLASFCPDKQTRLWQYILSAHKTGAQGRGPCSLSLQASTVNERTALVIAVPALPRTFALRRLKMLPSYTRSLWCYRAIISLSLSPALLSLIFVAILYMYRSTENLYYTRIDESAGWRKLACVLRAEMKHNRM